MARSLEQINAEYAQLCAKLGDITYKMKLMDDQLDSIYDQMDALNKEAAEPKTEESSNV